MRETELLDLLSPLSFQLPLLFLFEESRLELLIDNQYRQDVNNID